MNIELLKKVVSEAGDTLASLADDMNIGEEKCFIDRMQGNMGSVEIGFIRDRYNLTDSQVNDIFFD